MFKDFIVQIWKNICIPTLIIALAAALAIKIANWLILLMF